MLSLAPADGTNGGVVTNTTQTFGGKKTIDINIVGGATGSIPYQSGPSVTTLLATGATGTILTSIGPNLAPTWATIPVAKIFANSAQNIPQNVNYFNTPTPQTQLTLSGIQTNTASMTATANAITIPKSGYYMIIGSLELAVVSQISLQVFVTSGVGAPYILARNESNSGNYGSGFGSNWWQVSGIQYLSTGDVLILTAWQNGVVSAAVANILSYLSVAFISV